MPPQDPPPALNQLLHPGTPPPVTASPGGHNGLDPIIRSSPTCSAS